jgi:aryl-alcohol dehydrogenase-like predicted oxidoreductase
LRLALGTVQFGLDYGVANRDGMVSQDEASRILRFAMERGIDTLDTAAAYGDSESVLGAVNVHGWRIVSKLPPVVPDGTSVAEWAVDSVNRTLARLGQRNLYGLLLHRPAQLLEKNGEALYLALQRLKQEGIVSKIGVSIYGPDDLDTLCRHFDLDLVQAPFSVVDRRLISSGWMRRLKERGVELHARSAFLQGLLLMRAQDRGERFSRWQALWRDWDAWLAESRVSATEACIRYALSHGEIEKVVVGVQSKEQLAEIVSASERGGLDVPAHLSADSEDLLNPGRWSSLG